MARAAPHASTCTRPHTSTRSRQPPYDLPATSSPPRHTLTTIISRALAGAQAQAAPRCGRGLRGAVRRAGRAERGERRAAAAAGAPLATRRRGARRRPQQPEGGQVPAAVRRPCDGGRLGERGVATLHRGPGDRDLAREREGGGGAAAAPAGRVPRPAGQLHGGGQVPRQGPRLHGRRGGGAAAP
eukprot:scaffold126434_cov57-Phaeocystis_antarctica.AAC.3